MSGLSVKLWKDKAFLNGEFQELRRVSLELPGYKKFVNDSLLFETSGKNIEYLLEKSNIEWSGEAAEIANKHRARLENESKMKEQKGAEVSSSHFKFKTEPFSHQLKAFELSKDAEYYGYLMEMGTGKTKVIIDNAAYLYEKGEIDGLMIVAPNGVHAQWVNEQIPTHMPDWVRYSSATYRASEKAAMKQVDNLMNSATPELKIISLNIESFNNAKGLSYINKFLKKFKTMLVLDESTRIKSPSAGRTKNALKCAELAKYRRIMSGAPITKGYEDLYTQLKFLHPDVLGFNSFYTFRNYHCDMGGFEGKQIVGYRPNAIKELERKMEAYTLRVTKKECLDLPEKIYTKRYISLTDKQKELYNNVKKELAIDLRAIKQLKENEGDKKVDTALMSAMTKMLRMQQIVCGHFVIQDEESSEKKELIDIESNRIDALIECINEAQGKVIVWSRFVTDIHKISKELNKNKIGFRTYHGEVNSKDRESAINDFRNDQETKVFLAQPASGGTGLNLAVASVVIYFSNDFNADTRWQSEDRAHRIGQKNNVTYIDLVAERTIDNVILESLRSKKNLADALLDDPRLLVSEDDANE